MLAIALLLAILAGLQGSGPLDLRSAGARQELAAAVAHYARAPVVHETGTFRHDGHSYGVDVTLAKGGDSLGTVVVDGQKVEYRFTSGHAYVLATKEYWSSQARLSAFLAGRWVTSPAILDQLSTAALSRSLALLDLARPGVTFTRRGRRTRVGGVPADALSDRSGDLYVSTAGPTRFLRLVSSPGYRTADGITDVLIDLGYPSGLSVEAPSPVVDTEDPSTLPAQYVVEPDSFAFASCETSSGCTVTAAVRNRRGPAAGSPTAEFHLTRADGGDLGRCTAAIRPAGYGQVQTVSCTVSGSAWVQFSRVGGRYLGTVTVDNPFYDG